MSAAQNAPARLTAPAAPVPSPHEQPELSPPPPDGAPELDVESTHTFRFAHVAGEVHSFPPGHVPSTFGRL